MSSFPNITRSLLGTAILVLIAGSASVAQQTGPVEPVILEHADSLLGRNSGGEEILELQGNVRLKQGLVTITSDKARLYTARNNAILTGNVRVTQPGMTLTAPRADYIGSGQVATAPEGMTIEEDGATLNAGHGIYYMDQRKSVFKNGVTLNDDKATLQANAGEYYSIEKKAIFFGDVEVINDSGFINADHMAYWRDTEETFAIGDVTLNSGDNGIQLTGDTLHHQPAINYTLVLGSPKLVQIDSAVTLSRGPMTTEEGDTIIVDSLRTVQRDTTTITAQKMEAFGGEEERYIATDSVKLIRGPLQSVAAIARLLPNEDRIDLGPQRVAQQNDTSGIDSSSTEEQSDTAITENPPVPGETTGKKLRDKISSTPIVWYDESQLTGDSISISLSDKKVRAIDVLGNAFAVTSGTAQHRYDQLAGKHLLFNIEKDTIRFVRAEGLASSIYFLYEHEQPNGLNRSSGDTISIAFAGGQASRISILGARSRIEGEVIPENAVYGQESFYRLDGFRWYEKTGELAESEDSPVLSPFTPADETDDNVPTKEKEATKRR